MAKVFPIIFAVYFLRERDAKALCSLFVTVLVCLALVLPTFGWSMHRNYLLSVLPWTSRGEALPPYELATASFLRCCKLAAYLRTERGRAGLFSAAGQRLSPTTIDVLEAAYLCEGTFVVAGSKQDKPARLYALLPDDPRDRRDRVRSEGLER